MKFLRILPAMCARMRCPLSSSTMNWVLGRASTMQPSVTIGSSLATRFSSGDFRTPGVVGPGDAALTHSVGRTAPPTGRGRADGRDHPHLVPSPRPLECARAYELHSPGTSPG